VGGADCELGCSTTVGACWARVRLLEGEASSPFGPSATNPMTMPTVMTRRAAVTPSATGITHLREGACPDGGGGGG
jgi:hypothetical protein